MANPTISQISINGTTYDIRDVTARDTYTELFFYGRASHSAQVAAGTLVYSIVINIENLKDYCTRIFAMWNIRVAKDSGDARAETRSVYLPANSENTTMDNLGFNQSFNTTATDVALTGCENLYKEAKRWTFYTNMGKSYKVHYMGLNMYVFDCTKHNYIKEPCIIRSTEASNENYVIQVPNDGTGTNQTGHGILTISS